MNNKNADEVVWLADHEGNRLTVFHGTTMKFERLDARDYSEGAMFGSGVYFTSSRVEAERYASTDIGVNSDLVAKAERLAQSITRESGGPRFSEMYRKFRTQLTEGPGRVLAAHISMRKPLVIGAAKIVVKEAVFRLASAECDMKEEQIGNLYRRFTLSQSGIEQYERMETMNATRVYRQIATLTGCDGLVIEGCIAPKSQGATHYVAFHPEQIMEVQAAPAVICSHPEKSSRMKIR